MQKISLLLILVICGSTLSAKSSKDKNANTLIKRRVLILDFVNIKKSEDYTYLEQSIPDSFLDPLDQTKSFELLSRNLWTKLRKQLKYEKEDAYDQGKAIEAGRRAPADVIVMGSYTVIGSKMQINASAVDLSSGRALVSRSTVTPLTASMFQAINKLAKSMAQEMKEKLPPLPQKFIVKERVKYVKEGAFNTVGIIWRTLVVPGWGHLYSNRSRGWIYTGVWVGSLGFLGYSLFAEITAKAEYLNAPTTSNLDALYTTYNDSHKLRWYATYATIGVYAIAMLDGIIFKKKNTGQQLNARFLPIVGPRYQGFMFQRNF
ncbi:MAG: hypothetical protein ABUK01_11765 [Leptospirales bacterium]